MIGSPRARLRICVLVGLLSPVACSEAARPNLLMIVVDTLRADHIGAYGYGRDTTPNVDALAREAVRFERAYATAPWTEPSVASLITGLYPSSHGADRLLSVLPRSAETLAEVLSREEYDTAAVVSHWLIGKRFQFDQGYETLVEGAEIGGPFSTLGVTRAAVRLLEAFQLSNRPFYLFVHYFDPHYEYWRHPEVGFAAGSAGRLHGDEKMNRLRSLDPPPDAAELEFLRDLYDEEVRYTDLGIGRLLESLAALALDGDTIVVFVADHGEEFFERGWLGHTRTLYDELIRVPLLIRLPRERKGRSVSEPVSLASLMPTLLDLIGIETRELPFQAPSLAPLLRGRALPAPAPVYIEVDRHSEGVEQAQNAGRADLRLQPGAKPIPRQMVSKHAVIVGRYKLVEDRLSGSRELYDLERDPREQTDLAASEPRRVDELARDLEAMSTRVRAAALARERSERIPTQREFDLLRQLGYLEP